MKKKFLYLLLFIFITPYSFGSVSFIIKQHYAVSGTQVTVPVKVKDFLNIVSFQGTLQFDQTMLSFVSVQDFGLTGMNAFSFGTSLTGSGKITFSWIDGAMAGVSVTDSSTIFSVKFNVIGSNGQMAALSFVNTPTNMEVINSAFNSVPITLVNGAVHIQSTVPSEAVTFTLDSVTGTQGSQVSVSLRSTGFTNIISAQGTIQFDPTKVTYAGIGYYGLPGMNSGNFGVTQTASGKLTFSWYDATLAGPNMPAGAPLFSILFNLTGTAGTQTSLSLVNTPTPLEIIDSMQHQLIATAVNGRIGILGNTTQQTLRLKIDSTSGPNGSQVIVPVRAWHLKKLISIQGTISFNASVVTFVSVEQYGLTGLDASAFGTSQTGSGKLMFAWSDATMLGQTVADSAVLFAIRFNIIGIQGNVTPVDFVNVPTPLEFIDTTFSAMSSVLQSGRIRVTGNCSITSLDPSPLSYCAGNSIIVPYTITGNFNAGNWFILQLSDATGSFVSPTNIDTLISTTDGSFTTNLPVSLTSGSLYRVRVISTNPGISGTINTSNITISTIPATAATPSGATPICQGTVSGIYSTTGASGATTYEWDINPPSAGTTSSTGTSATITWSGSYTGAVVIKVRGINGCGNGPYSNGFSVNIVAIPMAPSGNISQVFCNSATVTNLVASGAGIQWYSASSGGSPLSLGTALTHGSRYYASQTINGCESSDRLEVTVTVNIPAAPGGSVSQTFCNSATVANLAASGSNIQWYSGLTGGSPLTAGTALISGNHYYASQTVNGCESINRLDVIVTVNAPAAPSGNVSQTFCNSATVTDLVAAGSNIQWYLDSTDGSPLATGTSLTNGTHYYASQTLSACESATRLNVSVTINIPSTPSGNSSQTFCNSATVANLAATGTSVQWYNSSTGGFPLPTATALNSGTHYFASQTINACESSERLEIAVTINTTAEPTGIASQVFCNAATIADLAANGTSIQWYLSSTGGSALALGSALSNGTHYFASQNLNSCESSNRLEVTVTINTTAAPGGNVSQTFCNLATVADLVASGTSIQWYTSSTNGSPLANGTSLANGAHYYASQTLNSCESSSRLNVIVTINAPASPTGNISQTFCNSATVANLSASGTGIQWYADSTGGSPLSPGDALVSGTHYYASQTISSCESVTRLEVNVTINVPAAPTGNASQTFCNSATVANLAANGSNIHWYTASTGGSPLATTTAIANGIYYFATQTTGGCESLVRLEVGVTINVPAVPVVNVSNNCGNSVLSTSATDSLLWTPGNYTSSQITVTTAGTYHVTQTINGCTSLPGSGVAAPKIIPVVFLGNDTTICATSSIVLNAGNPGSSYAWSPGGQTSQIVTLDSLGLGVGMHTVSVQVTQNTCTGSDAINITFSPCTGIEDVSDEIHFSLSPNPSQGLFNISSDVINGKVAVSIYNMSGQIISSEEIEFSGDRNYSFDLRSMAKGLYFVRINFDDKQFTDKLIIE